MRTIRREQMDAMLEVRLQEWWYDRARDAQPERFEALGETRFRGTIRTAVNRARQGSIQDPAEISQFIDLALLWGEEFDTPGQTPWVGEILGWTEAEPRKKIAALLERSERAMDERWSREQAGTMEP